MNARSTGNANSMLSQKWRSGALAHFAAANFIEFDLPYDLGPAASQCDLFSHSTNRGIPSSIPTFGE